MNNLRERTTLGFETEKDAINHAIQNYYDSVGYYSYAGKGGFYFCYNVNHYDLFDNEHHVNVVSNQAKMVK